MIRDPLQQALQELEQESHERLQRMEAIEPDQLCPEAPQQLEEQIEARRRLWEALAELSAAHDDLPRVSDPDATQLRSILDRLMEQTGWEKTLREQLAEAERQLASRVTELEQLDWQGSERAVLQQLKANAQRLAELLEPSAESTRA